MACPYFMPLQRLENGSWPHPRRLPLGAGWTGHCTASGHEGEIPSRDVLEAFCNLGYASGCAWAPRERAWDAVRFAVIAPCDAENAREPGEPNARAILLRYVCERNHSPVEAGDLKFDLSQAVWVRSHGDGRVQRMAECFLEEYLRKRV